MEIAHKHVLLLFRVEKRGRGGGEGGVRFQHKGIKRLVISEHDSKKYRRELIRPNKTQSVCILSSSWLSLFFER